MSSYLNKPQKNKEGINTAHNLNNQVSVSRLLILPVVV